MKRFKKYLFIILILPLFLCLNACEAKSVKKANKLITKSLPKVMEAVEVVEMYDGASLVFKQVKTVKYTNGDNAHVVLDKYELSPIATLEKTTTEADEEVSKNNLFVFNLNKEKVKDATFKDNFKCIIEKANMQDVLGSSTVELAGDINLEISFNEKLLESVSCTMKTSSNKDVSITTTYTY